ncbi:tripartite tricarboxylate transporter substrate binding protein [Comamonas sp. Z3]|nr:tripartite tricarboxylate transporter substrate binding protein [Comamonas sp. Z3]
MSSDLGKALGQSVIVDNRPGASGALGTRMVVRAAADGLTLLLGQTGEIAINGAAMKSPGYDSLKDLQGVALVGDSPLVLAVPASAPWKSLDDLIAAAKAAPGKVAYASSGTATPGHLAAAALAEAAKVQMVHIPYKGAGQAITDLIGAQVQFFMASTPSILSHIKGGKVRALAVTGLEPIAALPGVPTVAEKFPGFEFSLWGGYFAPRQTPAPVVQLLSQRINQIVQQPALKARFEAEGTLVKSYTPQEVDAFVRKEITKYRQLVRSTSVLID